MFWRVLQLLGLCAVVALTCGCSIRLPILSPAPTPTAAIVGSITASSSALAEPSPPGGLGNEVESYSRNFGRPTAAFGVSQPSYEYGQWPAQGLYVILDDSFRRAREVRINFGKSVSLADAQGMARAYLPVDAKLVRSFAEAGTDDPAAQYTSERLAVVFPSVQPPGSFVVVYDGQADQLTGLIFRVGTS
jgi:hypothetical protein